VSLVRNHCRWEHARQPFFSGEVEPCINGRTVTLGVYFDQNMDSVVSRLIGEQLEDGGWNCEAENGSVRSSFDTTINVLEGLLMHERTTGGATESIAARRRGEEYLLERNLFRRKSTGEVVNPAWLQFSFPTAGTTTCCVFWNTSARSEMCWTSGWAKPSIYSDPSNGPVVLGCWRTQIPARSTFALEDGDNRPSRWGTHCGGCVSSGGSSSPLP